MVRGPGSFPVRILGGHGSRPRAPEHFARSVLRSTSSAAEFFPRVAEGEEEEEGVGEEAEDGAGGGEGGVWGVGGAEEEKNDFAGGEDEDGAGGADELEEELRGFFLAAEGEERGERDEEPGENPEEGEEEVPCAGHAAPVVGMGALCGRAEFVGTTEHGGHGGLGGDYFARCVAGWVVVDLSW